MSRGEPVYRYIVCPFFLPGPRIQKEREERERERERVPDQEISELNQKTYRGPGRAKLIKDCITLSVFKFPAV